MASDWVADPGEHLANGWERDLASADTLLRAYTDAFAEMVVAMARAAGGRTLEDDEFIAADSGTPRETSRPASHTSSGPRIRNSIRLPPGQGR